jgi:transcriptional regulator with XRE-family HTH domain
MPQSDIRSLFAHRLKAARIAAGLTQAELGIRAGLPEDVASTRINRYEKAVHKADIETIEALAKVLGVPGPYLLANDDRLAQMILGFSKLSVAEQDKVLGAIRRAMPKDIGN